MPCEAVLSPIFFKVLFSSLHQEEDDACRTEHSCRAASSLDWAEKEGVRALWLSPLLSSGSCLQQLGAAYALAISEAGHISCPCCAQPPRTFQSTAVVTKGFCQARKQALDCSSSTLLFEYRIGWTHSAFTFWKGKYSNQRKPHITQKTGQTAPYLSIYTETSWFGPSCRDSKK